MSSFESSSGSLFQYDNINQAMEVYVKQFMNEKTAGVEVIHKNAAIKKTAATAIYSAIVFSVISIFMFYHEYSRLLGAVILAVVTGVWIKALRTCFTNESALRQKIQAMPDAEIDGILTSEMDNCWELNIVRRVNIAFIVCTGLLLLLTYMKPHMVFEKNDSGYGLRYYTLSLQPEAEVVIPDTWKGEPVTEIRGYVFYGMDTLEKVKLPKGIKEIRGSTFEQCRYLQSIEIPEGVTRIGGHAFCDCVRLSNVSIPSTMKSIGSSAFRRCYNLKSITIPINCSVEGNTFKESNTSVTRSDSISK